MTFQPAADHRLIILAFEGWNDAGEASVDAARHLIAEWELEQVATLGGEEFYDLGFIRPTLHRDGGRARIEWPGCTKHSGLLPGTRTAVDVIVGFEPSQRWQEFTALILEHAAPGDAVVLLGALLADSPHTRPLPVSMTSEADVEVAGELLERPSYEGPTGIVGVLSIALADAGIAAVSLWVAVPAYAASSPSPKAVLALLGRLEELTGLVLPDSGMVEDARAWERGTDALLEDDDDLAEYVARLEGMSDAAEMREASGEAIAREFERYLSRRRREI